MNPLAKQRSRFAPQSLGKAHQHVHGNILFAAFHITDVVAMTVDPFGERLLGKFQGKSALPDSVAQTLAVSRNGFPVHGIIEHQNSARITTHYNSASLWIALHNYRNQFT